jgi:hypothetical protein
MKKTRFAAGREVNDQGRIKVKIMTGFGFPKDLDFDRGRFFNKI